MLVAALVWAAFSGCGGIISTVFIIKGTVEVAGARAANAENHAAYEYFSAEAYLKKARESHSYADFEHSLRFARLASERAKEARAKALAANKPPPPVLGSTTTTSSPDHKPNEPQAEPQPIPAPVPAPQQTPPPGYQPAPTQPPVQ